VEGATHGARRRGRRDHLHLRRGTAGLDATGGASCDDVRRGEERGLPTARGGEGDATIFTYDTVLSGTAPLLPSPPPPCVGLVSALSMLGSCCHTHGVMRFDSVCLGEQVSGARTWKGSDEYEIAWQASSIDFGSGAQ
jgi:hypothetical protein